MTAWGRARWNEVDTIIEPHWYSFIEERHFTARDLDSRLVVETQRFAPAKVTKMIHQPVKTIVFFPPAAAASREMRWEPGADIYRSRCGWLIKLDLAGVRQSDVTIEVAGRRLAVRGRRRDLIVNEDWSHYSMEIAYSGFVRIIEMPCDLDRAAVKAELRDGMLLIYVTPEGER